MATATTNAERASGADAAAGPARPRPSRRALLAPGLIGLALALLATTALVRSRRDDELLLGEDAARYRAEGTWSDLFDPSDLANRFPLPVWAGALVLIGLIAFPYLWLAARALPDGGWSVARPIGLLLLAWPAWWLASVDAAPLSRGTLALVGVALLAGAVAIAGRHRDELSAWLRARWRVLALQEGVFWTIFVAFLAVRWSNPDLWHPSLGGEKPMDLAYLNAVVKSESFPPFDPWFAGGYVNYYYFGFVLVGALVELTAIAPVVAYNLAIPTLAAFLGLAAFGAALALVSPRGLPTRRALGSASLAAAFVALIGNLGELEVVLESLRREIPLDWWYWNASRAIAAPEGEPGPITEFPAFTYLYADLHAHAIALPYGAAVLVLGVAAVRGRRLGVGLFAVLALALGALWPLNTWDVPTYALVALLALAAAAGTWRALPGTAAQWAALVAAAYVLYLPFHLAYASAFDGVDVWRGGRTSLVDYLTVHGFFLFVITSALVLELVRSRDLSAVARLVRLLVLRPRRAARLHRTLVHPSAGYVAGVGGVVAAGGVVVALAVFVGGTPALIAALLALTLLLLPRRRRAASQLQTRLWQLALALFLLGLALTLAVELFVVAGIDIGRTNTVFKTYLQVWVLWGVAAAVALHRVYGRRRGVRRAWRLAWRGCFVLLFSVTLLYPVLATRAKVRDRLDPSAGRGLDGAAFMATARYAAADVEMPLADDLAAIRWFQSEVPGSPVVAEANTHPTLYGWGNRFAMFTGNPSVVGWDFHQRQQRGLVDDGSVAARIEDVQAAYRTTDPRFAFELLSRYGVTYVVVGRLERAYFPSGLAKWRQGVGRFWEVAYRNEGVTVYRLADA